MLIERQKDLILHYWDIVSNHQAQRFQNEIQIALLGNHPNTNWKDTALKQLQNNCHYLITNRGYQEWNL